MSPGPALVLAAVLGSRAAAAAAPGSPLRGEPVRIGYFHGLRIHMLFRTYINGCFEREGVKVDLFSKYVDRPDFYPVPRTFEGLQKVLMTEDGRSRHFGKVTGVEIVDAIKRGVLDGGVVGESSFLTEAAKGSPITAVAIMGRYGKGHTGRWLVLRDDVKIAKPEDFKGMTFAARRAGAGDAAILREFFSSIGLDPRKDVTIIEQVPDEEVWRKLNQKEIHGMLAHFGKRLADPEKWGVHAYAYREVDWLNPEITQALLVFRKDYLDSHRDEVSRVVRAYMERTRYERSLPEEERQKEKRPGLAMTTVYEGQKPPEYDYPPSIRMDLLEQTQRLLLKHRYIDKRTDLAPYVDLSVVEAAAEKLGAQPR